MTANVKTVRADNSEYHAVQVGSTNAREKTTTKQMLGHFKRAGVPPKQIVKEFPVTPDAHVPVGTLYHHSFATEPNKIFARNYAFGYPLRAGAVC